MSALLTLQVSLWSHMGPQGRPVRHVRGAGRPFTGLEPSSTRSLLNSFREKAIEPEISVPLLTVRVRFEHRPLLLKGPSELTSGVAVPSAYPPRPRLPDGGIGRGFLLTLRVSSRGHLGPRSPRTGRGGTDGDPRREFSRSG